MIIDNEQSDLNDQVAELAGLTSILCWYKINWNYSMWPFR